MSFKMNNLSCTAQRQPCSCLCCPTSKQFGPQYKTDKFGQQLMKLGNIYDKFRVLFVYAGVQDFGTSLKSWKEKYDFDNKIPLLSTDDEELMSNLMVDQYEKFLRLRW